MFSQFAGCLHRVLTLLTQQDKFLPALVCQGESAGPFGNRIGRRQRRERKEIREKRSMIPGSRGSCAVAVRTGKRGGSAYVHGQLPAYLPPVRVQRGKSAAAHRFGVDCGVEGRNGRQLLVRIIGPGRCRSQLEAGLDRQSNLAGEPATPGLPRVARHIKARSRSCKTVDAQISRVGTCEVEVRIRHVGQRFNKEACASRG